MVKKSKKALVRQALVVGIDIAKKSHYVQILDGFGEPFEKPFPVQNTMDGFQHLEARIKQAKDKLGLTNIVIGCEPTGHYHKPIAHWFMERDYTAVMVGSAMVKRRKEEPDNSPKKSDPKDAALIAQLISEGKYLNMILPRSEYAELRELTIIRRQLRETLTRYLNNLAAVLDEFFPEFTSVFKSKTGKAATWVLRNCPWPEEILRLSLTELAENLSKASKKHCGIERAKELQAAAKRSIGVREGLNSARLRLNLILDGIEETERRLADIEAQMAIELEKTGMKESLPSIPGVGVVIAAGFLGEIGDPRQYDGWRQVHKLAGLNIVSNSSGQHIGKSRISHRGRPGLRCLLYQATLVMVFRNPQFQALYHYFRTRPQNPLCAKAAMVAVSGKLLRVMMHLAKTGNLYDPSRVFGHVRESQIGGIAA